MPADAIIVVYRPQLAPLRAALQALVQAQGQGLLGRIHLWHNDAGPQATPGLSALLDELCGQGAVIQPHRSERNLGFGPAINAVLPAIRAPYLLLLNQDAIPEPGALERLWLAARSDAADVAAWELRQIPYEHPKDYDPLTGETGWFSGAAVLLRTDALRAVGGFEPRFFMYCEDVDLSWRLRCAGWRLRYLPQCAVVHRTYDHPGQVKPLAALQGVYANLCLRTRFAGRRSVVSAARAFLRRLAAPQPFRGYRVGLMQALLEFAANYRYFRRTRYAAVGFAPRFNGFDYEERRDGAFHAFLAQAERAQPLPAVTAIVRASSSAQQLEAQLETMARQTHALQEVIVVGGTAPHLQPLCTHWAARLALHPLPTNPAPLAAIAALHAQADWWLLQEDDAVLPYADHLEVLLQAAIDRQTQAAAARTWLIEARPAQHAQAHRQHAPRTTFAGQPAERPCRLLHRAAARATHPTCADIEKTTTVRYVAAAS